MYYTDEFTGPDTIAVADLPYAPDACTELTFDDFSKDGTAPGGVRRRRCQARQPAAARRGRRARGRTRGGARDGSRAGRGTGDVVVEVLGVVGLTVV